MNIPGGSQLLDPKKVLHQTEIGAGMTVADFGCGNLGHFVFPSADMVGDDGKVYAVDILKSVLSNIVSRAKFEDYQNVEAIWSNLEKYQATKIQDQSVDVGLLISVLFQTKNQEDILKEVARTIKPGGQLVVVDWKKRLLAFGPARATSVKKKDVLDIAKKLGLQLVKDFSPSQYHFGLLFEKTS